MKDIVLGMAAGAVFFLMAFGLMVVVLPWYGL